VIRPRASIAEFFSRTTGGSAAGSLNLGVRYTLNFPSTVIDDRGAVFNLHAQKLTSWARMGSRGRHRTWNGRTSPLALAFAYQLTDSLVMRAGYGMTWIEQAGITTPFTTPLFPFIQTLGQQTLDNIYPAFVLSQGPGSELQNPNPDSGSAGRVRCAAR
jgi:hypothetical protein